MISANKEYKLSKSTLPFNEWVEQLNKTKKAESKKQEQDTVQLNADGPTAEVKTKDGIKPSDNRDKTTKVTILGLTPANWALIGTGIALVAVIYYATQNKTTPMIAHA